MKLRLLSTLFATAMLGGCATYDYSAGSAPGGYYTGRPSVEYIGPYSGGYGYGGGYGGLSYGYGGYGGYGYLRSNRGFSGGYYPYYPYRPYYPHPPRPRPDTGNPNPQNPNPPGHGNRPPPWRNPDGRPHQIDQPPRPQYQGGPRPTGRPVGVDPGRPQGSAPPPRPMAPRPDNPRPVERAPAVRERARSNERIREVEP